MITELHITVTQKEYSNIIKNNIHEYSLEFTPYWCDKLIDNKGVDFWKKIFEEYGIEKLTHYQPMTRTPMIIDIFGYIKSYRDIIFHLINTDEYLKFEFGEMKIDGGINWGCPICNNFIINFGNILEIHDKKNNYDTDK